MRRRAVLLLFLGLGVALFWLRTRPDERGLRRGGVRPNAAEPDAAPGPADAAPPDTKQEDGPPPWSLIFFDYRIAGRVVDSAGRPVAGARIAYLASGLMWFGVDADWRREWEEVPEPTDEDGRFAIERLGGFEWWIAASKPGHAAALVEATAGDGSLVIELGPGATVTGRVFHADGRPAAGGKVGGAAAGADGSFVVNDLAPGPHSITAELGEESGQIEVDLREGECRRGVVIRLEPAPATSVVAVRILGPDGAPLAGAWLCVDAGDRVHGLFADETGGVRCEKDVPAGSDAWVEVKEDEERRFVAWRRAVKTLPRDTTEEITVRCGPPLRVAAEVRDADGLVPQGLKVWLSGGYEVEADPRLGRFVFDATPDRPSTCHAWADGFLTGSEEREPGDGEVIRIVLEREATVTGRVVEADGTPVSRVRVNHDDVTDEGRFRIGERAGTIAVEVQESLSVLEGTVLLRTVTLAAGGLADLGDLVLPPRREIAGVVTDAEGRPAGGVQGMAVQRETGAQSYFVTRADGVFRLRVRGDDLRVHVWKRGTGTAIGTPGDGPLALRLEPEPRVVLRIEREFSAVRWSTTDGFPLHCLWRNGDRVEALPPGPLRLEVLDGDTPVFVRDLDPAPGAEIPIDVR